MQLTRTVNFAVSSSDLSGSLVGSNLTNPSLNLTISCASYNANALLTSNFLAITNLTAVLNDI